METRIEYNQLPPWESTLGHGVADTGDRREKSGRGTDRRFGFVDSPPAPAIMGTALVGAILASGVGRAKWESRPAGSISAGVR